MSRAWAASLGGLLVLSVFVSALWQHDPLEMSETSYGTVPGGHGALYDTLVLLEVGVGRSLVAIGEHPPDHTVWWIEPQDLCTKLAGESESERGWKLEEWVRSGGTALIFSSRLGKCSQPMQLGDLVVPESIRPEVLGPDGEILRDPLEPWIAEGPLADEPRSLPVGILTHFAAPDLEGSRFDVVARVDGQPFAVEGKLGAGRLVLVADSRFLTNAWLDSGDAAPFALDWVRAYGVPHLDEREHGLSEMPSTLVYLMASPALAVFVGLGASGLLFAWSGASLPRRQTVDPAPEAPDLRSYIDSLARLYARAGDHHDVFERYREFGLSEVRRALHLTHDTPVSTVVRLLGDRPGVEDADLAVLRGDVPVHDRRGLAQASDAVDRLLGNLR